MDGENHFMDLLEGATKQARLVLKEKNTAQILEITIEEVKAQTKK